MKLQQKFNFIAVLSAVLVVLLVVVTQWSSRVKVTVVSDLEAITHISQRHMEGDMMHDAMRSDVLTAVIASGKFDARTLQTAEKDLNVHYNRYRDDLTQNIAAVSTPEVKTLMSATLTELDNYYQAAQNVMVNAGAQEALERPIRKFDDAFTAMEARNEQISDALFKWAAAEKAKVASSGSQTDTIVLIISALVMAISIFLPIHAYKNIFAPLDGIIDVMKEIADGHTAVKIPGFERQDEIGSIAASVEVFRQNTEEREKMRLERIAAEEQSAKDKTNAMEALARSFESRIQSIIQWVTVASTQLAQNSERMGSVINDSNQTIQGAVASASETSANVQSVASAAEEMSATVQEISTQIHRSNDLVSRSVTAAEAADNHASALMEATQKVRQVIQLISDISGQINLLALNATIESARAGDAGKGFAVVAGEVKNLASQTDHSIQEISKVINEMNAASDNIVESLRAIKSTVNDISESSSNIASAVEEQSATTNEIAHNMQTAAYGTGIITDSLADVNHACEQATVSSHQVREAAQELSQKADQLNKEVHSFLDDIRAA